MSKQTRIEFWESLTPDDRRQLMVELGLNTEYFRNKFINQPKTLKLYQVETLLLYAVETGRDINIEDFLDEGL